MTVEEYDTQILTKAVTGSLMPLVMISFLHFQFGFLPPLIISPVNNLYDLFTTVWKLNICPFNLAIGSTPFVKRTAARIRFTYCPAI